ncbi:Activating enzyme of the ubiquitin-like protein [Glarea lozoyensis ATCC 20868]|uniref:Adenylyltransferase and sulfurtransferase uba4 n=1 Tax=Glarea lozoyensis (strain ATCC 20868 / MF5171) TaxID=1116229 RepID=S3CSN5_GLAL2|nr:Activating enzyme of the ubiquitin-like protein [Glarea lozoyensis ATCC 20868]EPE28084.1 Activating enzyme of the ubiquitin-like protein [Glarea lozoyensis ATCC 20868]
MERATTTAKALRAQITATELQLQNLKAQLATLESQEPPLQNESEKIPTKWPLTPDEYKRYGRQMIVPNIGIQGQLNLKNSKVLIIGAGGLGCPSSVYLAGAGIGTLGLVDGDIVELSNLHRQILHSTSSVGMKKVDSVISYLKKLNPNVRYVAHPHHLTPQNAAEIVSGYDIVLDCTDHPTSRYLISDTCVLLSKPLVSASALRTDGQLIVLNSPPLPQGNPEGGPCYRCIFPKPPPVDSVVSCGDGGILGPVVGVMGVLQALETVKYIVAGGNSGEGNSMLLFSAKGTTGFRSLKMRKRNAKCVACSSASELTLEGLKEMDYSLFCGVSAPVSVLRPEERVEAREYERVKGKEHLLVDVREKIQFDICSLEGSINVPFSTFEGSGLEQPAWLDQKLPADAPIYVVCRLGNDSQIVARKLKELGLDQNGTREIKDIKGGLKAWRDQVDSSWPEY